MQTDTRLADPLTAVTAPDRPNYALGVMLDATDFVDEQTYHRGRLSRALQVVNGHGTVAGLEVTYAPAVPVGSPDAPAGHSEELRVGAGLAIDGIGRLIEVPRDACITLSRWWDAQTNDALSAALKPARGGVVADVFLRFVACGRGRTPAFASGPFDALDATVYSRVRDGYELRLVPRPEDAPPTPPDPWAAVTGATPADKLASVKTAVFARWRELALRRDRSVPPATIDPQLDWLLLARIVIAAAADGARPRRLPAAPTIDNQVRSFSLPTGALLRLLEP